MLQFEKQKQKGLAAVMNAKMFNISVQPILPFILEIGGTHITRWFLVCLVFCRILQSVVISMIQVTVTSYTFKFSTQDFDAYRASDAYRV